MPTAHDEADRDRCVAVIGDALRDLRDGRRLTQADLAERSGVRRELIGRIERGNTNASTEVLARLVRGLDVPLIEVAQAIEVRRSARDARSPAEALGTALANVRAARGLSRATAAERVGASVSWVIKMEHGVIPRPGIAVVTRFARALDISVAPLARAFVLARSSSTDLDLTSVAQTADASVEGAVALGALLRDLRTRRSVTVRRLARASGVSENHITRIEHGQVESTSLAMLASIAHGLHIDHGDAADCVADLARAYAGEREAPPFRALPVEPSEQI